MPERVFDDIACTVCGCVCDDLRITVRGSRVVRAERACRLAEPWFLAQESQQPPAARIEGREVAWEEGVRAAAALLRRARSPLIYGLSRSSTPGQRAAVRLADQIGATIDTTASRCHAPSIMALQQVGESTCSLGEARHRADLVVFWGSNPADSHPRHTERYSVEPAGLFVRGRADRHVVVVDIQPTATSAAADTFLQIPPGTDFEVLWTLRTLIRDLEPIGAGLTAIRPCGVGDPRTAGAGVGDPRTTDTSELLPALRPLAARMKTCRCGIVFFGLGLTRQPAGHANVEALLRLVTDLNRYTRFHARRMRVPGDVAGADSVLCWQTGFPFSVNLARGFPRYSPGEYSANDMLERQEADLCLLVGSEGLHNLSAAALDALRRVPLIVLDYPTVTCPLPPTVAFTTAVYGVHLPGTAYRMDEVPIPLRPFLSCSYPSDAAVLQALAAALLSSSGGPC